jgi:GldM N-terminal domain
MKNNLTYIGFIATMLSILGVIFKFQHWPGASIALVLGIGLFSLIFLPYFGYTLFYNLSDNKSKPTAVSAAILFSLIGLSTLFKIMHWPGSSALLVLEFFVCSLFVFPFLMISKVKTASTLKEKILQISWYLSFSFLLIGYCFKIMHWPSASFVLSFGACLLLLVYLPLALNQYNTDSNRTKLHQRFVIIPLVLLFVLITISTTNNLGLFADLEAEIKLNTSIAGKKNTETVEEFSKDEDEQTKRYYSKIQKVKELSDDLCTHIEHLKSYLISRTDKTTIEEADSTASKDIASKDNYSVSTQILIGNNTVQSRKGANTANELKAKVFVLQKAMIDMCVVEEKDSSFNVIGLNTDDIYIKDEQRKISWEEYHFNHIPLIGVITYLTLLQNNVRVSESSALESLKNAYIKNHDFKFNTRLVRGDTLLLYKRKK